MCLLLEHENPSKTSEKMGYFDPVTVSLHILYTTNQETEGSQYWLTVYNMERLFFLTWHFVPQSPFGQCAEHQRVFGLLIFKMANKKVNQGQIRSEESFTVDS